jgi:uncharacterized iron-regulated membrane protein
MSRQISRWAYHTHLWIGVLGTVLLIVIAVTGILLNHKRTLGLMPDVAHEPSAPFASALSMERIGAAAFAAIPADARGGWNVGDPVDLKHIERMDVRPRNGYAKVRFRDRRNTEATVDLASARVIHVGERDDVFLEKLHSGEILGDNYILLSDIAAIALVITLVTGYWLWITPRFRRGHAERDT